MLGGKEGIRRLWSTTWKASTTARKVGDGTLRTKPILKGTSTRRGRRSGGIAVVQLHGTSIDEQGLVLVCHQVNRVLYRVEVHKRKPPWFSRLLVAYQPDSIHWSKRFQRVCNLSERKGWICVQTKNRSQWFADSHHERKRKDNPLQPTISDDVVSFSPRIMTDGVGSFSLSLPLSARCCE